MARKTKITVDYFPHYVHHRKTLYTIEARYGNDGYAFWFKLLELLADSDNHYIDITQPEIWEFLLARTNFDEDRGREILTLLSKLGAIDPQLYSLGIVWSENFVDNIRDVYHRRSAELFDRDQILILVQHRTASNATSTVVSSVDQPEQVYVEVESEEAKPVVRQRQKKKRKDLDDDPNTTPVILPWEDEGFKNAWEQYKIMRRKAHGFKYKSAQSEQAALMELSKLAEKGSQQAVDILLYTISNEWKGFYLPKTQSNDQRNNSLSEKINRGHDLISQMYSQPRGN